MLTTDIQKLIQRVDLLEKKLDTALTYLEQIRTISDVPIVSKDMLLETLQDAAKQTKQTGNQIEEKIKEEEKTEQMLKETPKGKQVHVDDIYAGKWYVFEVKSWIAKQKEVETVFTAEISRTTDKALQLITEDDTHIWIPKSQIKRIWEEEK